MKQTVFGAFPNKFLHFFFLFLWSLSNLPTTTRPLAAADFRPAVRTESKILHYERWSVHPAAYSSESAARTLEHVCWVDCFSRSSDCGRARSLLCSQRLCLYVCLVVSHCCFAAEIRKKQLNKKLLGGWIKKGPDFWWLNVFFEGASHFVATEFNHWPVFRARFEGKVSGWKWEMGSGLSVLCWRCANGNLRFGTKLWLKIRFVWVFSLEI